MLVNPLNARNQLLWIEIQSKGNKLVPELTDVNEHYDQWLFVCFSQQIIWTSRMEESRSPTGLNLFFPQILATQRVYVYPYNSCKSVSVLLFLILQGHCTDIAGYCPEMASGSILLHC